MEQELRFHPDIADWWQELVLLPGRLGRIHLWSAADHPLHARLLNAEEHPTTTLVACLRGVVRVEGRISLDLRPGDVLLIRAGVWHCHHALRPGGVSFRQGFMAGRSDWHLSGADLTGIASIAAEPSRGLIERAVGDVGARPALVRDLLATVARERPEPLQAAHPALLRMEYEIYRAMHLPGQVSRIIRASGVSRAQAYRLARGYWGVGLAEHLQRTRLVLAEALLAQDLTPTEVARRAGFTSLRSLRLAHGHQGRRTGA
jgi:AraC-like DNA-binding protein